MPSFRRLVRLRKLTKLFSTSVTVVILDIFTSGILETQKNSTGTLSILILQELNKDLEDCSLRLRCLNFSITLQAKLSRSYELFMGLTQLLVYVCL